MFGPNPYHEIKIYREINYSHRDEYFKNVYRECKELFSKKFYLEDYNIIFLTCPATVAMEILISSLDYNLLTSGIEGKFKDRWESMINQYNKKFKNKKTLTLTVDFETSNSTYNQTENSEIIDAVSSFPFNSLNKNNQIIVTCVNKIIGSAAGISVILIRKDTDITFKKFKNYSFLDLEMHINFSKNNQTSCTASLFLFETLRNSLIEFDIEKTRKKIEDNCKDFLNLFEKEYRFLPTITFSKNLINKELAEKYCIYGYNDNKTPDYQIFTYSESREDYKKLIKEIRETKC